VIKAIIFDVGGVLVRTYNRRGRDELEQRLGLAPGQSEEIVFNSEMGRAAQMGSITTEQLWAWVQEHLDLSDGELAAFQRDFWSGDRLDTALVDLVRSLRGRYRTAIISNATDNLHHTLAEVYPMADAFDLIVGSAYERVMKPDAAIFERTLARLGCLPAEAVFVDDFAHNVAGARAAGLHAIHFTPGIDLPAELARLGVVRDAW
jgi:glucose-1-phosphatase